MPAGTRLTPRRSWIATATATLSVVAGAGAFAFQPAAADPYPAANWLLPDRGDHTYCWNHTLADDLKNNAAAAANNIANQTVVTVVARGDCNFTAYPGTDVIWENEFLGEDTYGQTDCHDVNGNGNCDTWRVDINPAEIREDTVGTYLDEYGITKTSCHEFGHTLGLEHHDQDSDPPSPWGCMVSGVISGDNVEWRRYVRHHIDHVNGWFS